MRDARDQSSKCRELFGLDQRVLRFTQVTQRRLGGVLGASKFPLAALALADIDMRADPAIYRVGSVAQRHHAGQERAKNPVLSRQRQLRLDRVSVFKRLGPALAENRVPAMRVDFSGRPARVLVPVIVEPVDRALGIGHPDQLRDGIRQRVELALACRERCLGALVR